jgi:hypothetical protein
VRKGILACIAFLMLGLAGCTTAGGIKESAGANFQWTSPSHKLVLVEPDVQLGQLEAGGTLTPRADWSRAAKDNIKAALTGILGKKSTELVDADPLSDRHEIQLAKLHGAVSTAIRLHLYGGDRMRLPNKGDALDWSLGPGAQDFQKHYGADYGLFITVRDSYSTAGRTAVIVLGALVGMGMSGGSMQASVSLVDLRTGNIVWFNFLTQGTGDLRTPQPAQAVVDELLGKLPI